MYQKKGRTETINGLRLRLTFDLGGHTFLFALVARGKPLVVFLISPEVTSQRLETVPKSVVGIILRVPQSLTLVNVSWLPLHFNIHNLRAIHNLLL